MDEGDDYVPQISQLGDYGGMGGMGTGPPPGMSNGPPSGQAGYPPMAMSNPYEQQTMMMMGQAPPPQAAPAPAPKSSGKGRGKKKEAALDPMQSMAAMSNNPMMRPSMQQMGGGMYPQQAGMNMYPAGGPPQQSPHYPPNAYRPGPAQGYPPQGYPQMQQAMGQPYGQRPGYPPQAGYGYPPQGYPQGAHGYPPQQMRPQYPQGQQMPNQGQYWDPQQQYFQQQQNAHSIHPGTSSSSHQGLPQGGPAAATPDQWNPAQNLQQTLASIEYEMRGLQQRLQYLYQQKTAGTEAEVAQYQHRMQMLHAEQSRIHMMLQQQSQSTAGQQMPPHSMATPHSAANSMSSMQNTPHMPSSVGSMNSQIAPTPPMVSIQHQNMNNQQGPVEVTQSGQQVQVNIKPETSGRTLISIQHRYGESSPEQKDSVPPEPIPTNSQAYNQQSVPSHDQMSQQSGMVPNSAPTMASVPYSGGQNGDYSNGYQQHSTESCPPQPVQPSQHSANHRSMQYPGSAPEACQPQQASLDQNIYAQPPQTEANNIYDSNGIHDIKPSVSFVATEVPSEEVAVPQPEQEEVKPDSEPCKPEPEVSATNSDFGIDLNETPEDEVPQRIEGEESNQEDLKDLKEDSSEEKEEEPMETEFEAAPTEQEESIDQSEDITMDEPSDFKEPTPFQANEEEDEEEEEAESTILDQEDLNGPEETSSIDDSVTVATTVDEVVNDDQQPGTSVDSAFCRPDEIDADTNLEDASSDSTKMNENDKEVTPSEMTESVDGFTEPSTPLQVDALPSVKKSTGRRPFVPKPKKKKTSDDSGDDDDDFIPEPKAKKSKKAKKEQFLEAEQKQSKWAMDSPATTATGEDEIAEDSILTTDSAEQQDLRDQWVIEKLMNSREVEGEEELHVKWKGKSYMHCEWKTVKELEELDKRAQGKIKRFRTKRMTTVYDPEEEDFNQDYLLVDRVVDIAIGDDGITEYALIKWKSLGYEEVTWEPLAEIEKENLDRVELWRQRQKIDRAKTKERTRPKPSEWKKMPEDIVWKDGNSLREYQFEGVDWLLYCYYTEQNCILADEMGLGKTVQTITFLSQIYEYGIHGPFLIVVPLSTIQNWVREFETWTDMNAVVYHGSAHSREVLQQYEIFYSKEHSGSNKAWRKNMVKLDALITTFEMVVTDCEFLRKINWRVCVIDEAHRLKNRNCKLLTGGLYAFRMEHRVLLTGTPLQNNIEELFSLLNFLHPQQFHSSAEFMAQFGQCQTDDQVQKLQEILKPMMLRRLKEDVEKSLQPKQETIIEVQLSDTQKKYYRAILERNFSHLCKGSSAPSLMNVMMELRKCCNHPFLIKGAEESILGEMRMLHPDWDEETLAHKALVQASGKVVLIEKLLPKLKSDGHRVLIFSQMVKVLDLLEEFLVNMSYTYERIDGNVRGDIRQASIDRFSKKDSDRFVFLLCTRAGGLGINLTAADTVIIFDSDWNPQNDLQAQARCHRIGQTKTVKVYRLVTANTYEREMFDKASMKLGLDKAVLQSTTALRDSNTSLSKKDVEELLKKGAYGSLMDETNEGSKFSEEDIETILQRRTHTITLEQGQKGSLFAKATFNSTHNKGDDIDIDDPNFWTKWAEKAQVDIEKATATPDGRELIIQEPRKRTKRFEDNSLKEGEESDGSEGSKAAKKRGTAAEKGGNRKRRRGEDEDGDYVSYRPDELAFNKSEYFKVEKVLASWGWGRWAEIKKHGELEVSEMDIMHMSRTLLLHCVRESKSDERTRRNVWTVIIPPGVKPPKDGAKGNNIYNEGWAVLPEYNPPNFALDATFQRHIHRHANKLLAKIDQLNHLHKDIIDKHSTEIMADKDWKLIDIKAPALIDPLCENWDADCDKSLLIGIYKHGLEGVEAMQVDKKLVFAEKAFTAFPTVNEIAARFRRLVALSQKSINDPELKLNLNKKEQLEYTKCLKAFGLKDKNGDGHSINWDLYRTYSASLATKTDEDLQEMLFCLLAACSRAQGGALNPLDTKRALAVEPMTHRQSQKLMNRLHLTRKMHQYVRDGLDNVEDKLKHCNTDAMPSGWGMEHDKELLQVCDEHGIENISTNILNKPVFTKIIRPTERTLLRRIMEIISTIETGKWNGLSQVDQIEESDTESTSSRNQTPTTSSTTRSRSTANSRKRANQAEDTKMRALLQQSMLSQMNDQTLATAMLHSLMMPGLLGGSSNSSSSNNANAANAQLLAAMLAMAASSTSSGSSNSSSSNSQQQQQQQALLSLLMAAAAGGMDNDTAMSIATLAAVQAAATPATPTSKKSTTSTSKTSTSTAQTPATTEASASSSAAQAATTSTAADHNAIAEQLGITINDLMMICQLPDGTKIPMRNPKTKEIVPSDQSPTLKTIMDFMKTHTGYHIDMSGFGGSSAKALGGPSTSAAVESAPASAKPSAPPTPKSATPKPVSKAPTPAPSTPAATPKPEASPRLEPGEVVPPRKNATATATVVASSSQDGPVAVFNRLSGEIYPIAQWPQLSGLAAWLASNPEGNVHSSCVTPTIQATFGSICPDRLGGDNPAGVSAKAVEKKPSTPAAPPTPSTPVPQTAATVTSSSSASNSAGSAEAKLQQQQALEAMQMQILLQQAMLQQSLMGGFNPYSMPTTSTSTSTKQTSSASANAADAMNPLLMASLMTNPLAMQALMMDPTALALMTAGMGGSGSTSGTSKSKSSKQNSSNQ